MNKTTSVSNECSEVNAIGALDRACLQLEVGDDFRVRGCLN